MSVTVDVKTILIFLVLIALVVLIVYAIMMIKKLMVTLEHTNKILSDVEVVSGIASERSQDLNNIITNVSGSVAGISSAVKGEQGTIPAIASIMKSVASIRGMVSKNKEKDD